MRMRIVVAGAGGAIGGHLVKALLDEGHEVRAVDIKPLHQWWQRHPKALNIPSTDCSIPEKAGRVVVGADQVYDLAENMGGIGFITNNHVECAESIEIGISMLRASAEAGVSRFFFSSSACVYNTEDQKLNGRMNLIPALKEEDAWPAQPEEGYGFSKLYMEELCRAYTEERGLETRVARYHNVFGEPCSWNDGREKSPAAICRKVAEAAPDGEIDIWGNGRQVRSYMHVSDCVKGTMALMASDHREPINLGSDRAITVNQLVDMVETIAGKQLVRRYSTDEATGVDGRNANIQLAKKVLGWEPLVSLEEGLGGLYRWITARTPSGAGR